MDSPEEDTSAAEYLHNITIPSTLIEQLITWTRIVVDAQLSTLTNILRSFSSQNQILLQLAKHIMLLSACLPIPTSPILVYFYTESKIVWALIEYLLFKKRINGD